MNFDENNDLIIYFETSFRFQIPIMEFVCLSVYGKLRRRR